MPTKVRTQGGAPEVAPPPATHTLPSGRSVEWQMPDVFSMIAFAGTLPNPVTAAVIKLLVQEGSFVEDDDPRYYHAKAEHIRGMYGIAQAMLVTPKFDASREWGDGNGTLGRRELGYADAERLYLLFRVGPAIAAATADPGDAGGLAEPASDSDGVPSDASRADGDE